MEIEKAHSLKASPQERSWWQCISSGNTACHKFLHEAKLGSTIVRRRVLRKMIVKETLHLFEFVPL